MVNKFPKRDQAFALGFIKKLVLAWDHDYTKVTPVEKVQLDRAAAEMAAGDYLAEDAINWN